ncbi:ubiquinol-cytochrome c reductase complex assembly factor 4 [Thomomys bottae]
MSAAPPSSRSVVVSAGLGRRRVRFCATEVTRYAERRAEVAMSGAAWSVPASGAVRALRRVGGARALHPPPRPRAPADGDQDPSRPFPFSPSPATPSRWTVLHSLGKQQKRSGWKALPFGLSLSVLVGWCYLSGERGSDQCGGRVLGEETPAPRDGAAELQTPAACVVRS